MRAMSFSAAGDKQSALRELNAAVKVQPRNTCYLGARANLLYELARYDDARADCDACLAVLAGHELSRHCRDNWF